MRRLWPPSLFARLMLIWLIGIACVLATSLALFRGERDRHDRDLLIDGLVRDISSAVEVLDRLAPSDRAAWIDTLGRRRLRFMLAPPPLDAAPLRQSTPLGTALAQALPGFQPSLLMRTDDDRHPHRRVLLSLRLSDGSPLTVRLPAPPPPAFQFSPERALAALIAFVVGLSLIAWFAVRTATRPIRRMAEAAIAIGENPDRPPLDPHGPPEVRMAARALNQMQQRVREHVAERTRILAAISHDLQTPITRLRLRAELVDDDNLRDRIQSDLDAMQSLVKEGLDYARSLDSREASQATDIDGLLAAVADDAADMGWPVAIAGSAGAPCPCQPQALRRALWNLIGNGVKYGEQVEIAVLDRGAEICITIRDHGPGLPETELEKVFEPFYRTESSRNRDTGGTGLGLAIARNLLQRQGGEVRLANAAGGGLIAEVRLPRRQVEKVQRAFAT